jgi:putative endonuclease
MFYVYILYSEAHDKFYVGHTENYKLRLEQHNTSEKFAYTSTYRPWTLAACFEAGNSRNEAIKIEKQIKKLKSKIMISRIIEGNLPDFLSDLKRII